MSRPVVIIIRGPSSTGKTTASLFLRERLSSAIRISPDTIHSLASPRTWNSTQFRTAELGSAVIAVEYYRAGFSCILDSTFETREQLAEILNIFEKSGVKCYIITLRASLEVLLHRNSQRDQCTLQPERIQFFFENFDWEIGEVVTTDGKSIEEVGAEILTYLDRVKLSVSEYVTSQRRYCLFIRHGEYQLTVDNVYPRGGEGDLTTKGVAQAKYVREVIKSFSPDVLVVSPFDRTRQTAQIVQEQIVVPTIVHDSFRERLLGVLGGRSYETLAKQYSEGFMNKLFYRSEELNLPGEETIEEAQERVVSAMQELTRSPELQRIAVIAHGGPHAWLCCYYLNIPIYKSRLFSIDHAHYSIFEFDSHGNFSRIRCLNAHSNDVALWQS